MTGDGEADAPLDIDLNSEDFHQDSAVDSCVGLDGGLGLSGSGAGSGGGSEDGADFDSFAGDELSLHDHLRHQAGECLSGAGPGHRRPDHRPDRRDRLFPRLRCSTSPSASASPLARGRAGARHRSRPSTRPASARATWPNASRCRRRTPIATIRRMARLIDNLDYLAKGNLAALKRICGVDDEDLADMIRELRAYDPKPGLPLRADRARSTRSCPTSSSPGAAAAGRSSSTSATLPRLLVNRSYYVELAGGPQDKAVEGLALRMPAKRQLADEGARPARSAPSSRSRARSSPSRRASSATASRI